MTTHQRATLENAIASFSTTAELLSALSDLLDEQRSNLALMGLDAGMVHVVGLVAECGERVAEHE